MPELPDLVYIRKHLRAGILQRRITGVTVADPVVVRNTFREGIAGLLTGTMITEISLRGPFFRMPTSGAAEILVNLMLAGRFQLQQPGEKQESHLVLSFAFDDELRLNLCDDEKMSKVYLVPHGCYEAAPGLLTQGVDVLGPEFDESRFLEIARRNSRKQVRSFINDHTQLSSIGNAYADEILFDARLHPKTLVAGLSRGELLTLYSSIRSVLAWGIACVEEAARPIHVKVRGHLKVRNRKGEPCPRCGATIRRAGVRGYDVFFCPACQLATRAVFVDWQKR